MFFRCLSPILLACILLGLSPIRAHADELPEMREVRVVSSIDGTSQPSRIWVPDQESSERVPLMIFLHSWSGDYRQNNDKWLRQAVNRGWIYFHPNFRGRNDDPQAGGSPLARQDILDGLDWVVQNHQVDPARVYLAGTSGGGHMAMLMAGHHSERFSAVSAWVGISDLAEWYRFHCDGGVPANYAQMVAACCGGAPGDSAAVDAEYHDRSPIHWMDKVGDLPLDLNAGVTDGKTGSVPFQHSLRAFNVVAKAGGHRPVTQAEMNQLWEDQRLADPLPQDTASDLSYGREILLRRHAGAARVTIFQGGHEGLPLAACDWLAQQSRPVSLGTEASND